MKSKIVILLVMHLDYSCIRIPLEKNIGTDYIFAILNYNYSRLVENIFL
jgi:hypothetical protein